jgi:FixJ family two-component response regulator
VSEGVVYLIDDDASFLRSMVRLLSAEGFEVSGYGDPTQLLHEISSGTRGCIVADLDMPGIDGLELQTRLSQANALLPMVFLTGHGDIPSTVRAMRDGAVDFLEKSATNEQLVTAIRAALARDSQECAARMRLQDLQQRFARLTKREREVLVHVVHGEMNKQIAAALGINERTVKLHRTAITTKLAVHTAAQLATLVHEVQSLERNSPAEPAPRSASRAAPPSRTFP